MNVFYEYQNQNEGGLFSIHLIGRLEGYCFFFISKNQGQKKIDFVENVLKKKNHQCIDVK